MPYSPPSFNYNIPSSAFDVSTPGGLSAVTEYINRLNRNAQTTANNARIPGAAGLETQSSQNIAAELRGEVPADVIRLLGQQAAERGAGRGMGAGAPATMASYLQALGLTSIGQQKQGQSDLTAADARNPVAPLFDPTTQLLTPYQHGQLSLQAQEAQDRARLEQQRIDLEAERIAGEQDAAARRYAGASGGAGGIGAPSEFSGYGGEYTVPGTATGTYRGGILYGPPSAASLLPTDTSSFYGPTTTGSGTYYAGSNMDPNAWLDQFYNEWDQAGTPVPQGGADLTGAGLPGNDFVMSGMIGSDAGPVDYGSGG